MESRDTDNEGMSKTTVSSSPIDLMLNDLCSKATEEAKSSMLTMCGINPLCYLRREWQWVLLCSDSRCE